MAIIKWLKSIGNVLGFISPDAFYIDINQETKVTISPWRHAYVAYKYQKSDETKHNSNGSNNDPNIIIQNEIKVHIKIIKGDSLGIISMAKLGKLPHHSRKTWYINLEKDSNDDNKQTVNTEFIIIPNENDKNNDEFWIYLENDSGLKSIEVEVKVTSQQQKTSIIKTNEEKKEDSDDDGHNKNILVNSTIALQRAIEIVGKDALNEDFENLKIPIETSLSKNENDNDNKNISNTDEIIMDQKSDAITEDKDVQPKDCVVNIEEEEEKEKLLIEEEEEETNDAEPLADDEISL